MIYKSIIINKMDTWDYQWAYARHKNSGMACVPTKSLIQNIGFGEDATHTFGDNYDNVDKHEISLPLKQNNFIVCDKEYDNLFFKKASTILRIVNEIKRIISK